MPVHIVVGGQFGSEGKGKVALHFAKKNDIHISVKVSGINAGHTVFDSRGNKYIFRILPACSVMGDVTCVLSAGCIFKPSLLFEELDMAKEFGVSLKIHPNAGIITDEVHKIEKDSGLIESIGSTGTGTGEATYRRLLRNGSFVRAEDIPELAQYICDTSEWMCDQLNKGKDILIEGAQGYGLSALGDYWPYCTSRATTASAFLSESGLSPFDVKNIAMVLRSYPIRVGGNSGPLLYETTWEQVTKDARSPTPLVEYTSVSNRKRRVARFDPVLVKEAQRVNQANIVVLNFLDYIWDEHNGIIGNNRRNFIDMVKSAASCPVTHVGFDGTCVLSVEEAGY